MQNTEEWYRHRMGKPTASKFDKIITTAGRRAGAPRYEYMYQLVYERIYKRRISTMPGNYWTERGKLLEPHAARKFTEMTGLELMLVGFLTTDNGKIGASPDRIVNWKHAVQIKCPTPWNHIRYSVMGPEKDYKAQLQGEMYVGEFDRLDFFSYAPCMPCVIHTVYRDDEYLKAMHVILQEFADELDEAEKKARALGTYLELEVLEEHNGKSEWPIQTDHSMDEGAGTADL